MERRHAVLILAASLHWACFEAEVPLGPPGQEPLDTKLAGEWQCQPPEGNERATLTVLPFDDSQYFVEWREGHGTDDVARYRAHPTRVDARTIVNLAALDTAPAKAWSFARYAFEGERLRVFLVDEEALGTKDGAAGLAALRVRVMDDALYRAFAVCTK